MRSMRSMVGSLSLLLMTLLYSSFYHQNELFSRNRRQLRSKGGKTASRINTDFLSLRRHAANPGVNDSMVRPLSFEGFAMF